MNNSDVNCKNLPNTLSSFIDTFVDFSVAGIFLPDPPSPPFSQTTYPPPDRLIAVGDLHGDLFKSKQALRLAGLIDADDRWSGGSSVLVQVGDVLDRGGQEIKILYFLEKLKRQAVKDGGNVITMNGNHEIMNLDGNFFCTFPSGFEEFKNWAYWYTTGLKDGVSSNLVRGRNSVVWNRKFSNKAVEDCDCSVLEHVLATIPGARRMIMGHTIQTGGINAVCDGKAVRIDVGMSQGCINGLPEVLEITGNSHLQVLTSKPVYDSGRQDLVVPEELKVLEVQVKA
ncbi:hypothetical protein E3N88_01139 [Mikania micrantha]|uniref:Calcineurin-like phosphoesterase domain-containing protein n=1 Tax=Mikania micrantha TaxID=192012 RepID=A0A5N6Q0U5_9ASTR|nr:hypothetical protein E3N88_01139 [Mikania micrantha]